MLVGIANGWTVAATWPLFLLLAGAAAVTLALRGTAFLRRAARDGEARASAATALGLFSVALALRALVPEWRHYTYNDEYEYVAYAKELARSGRYLLFDGPPTGVALYAIALRLVGPSPWAIFGTTILLASATPPAFFWLARSFGSRRSVAAAGALLLALAPLHVKHAASASLEVASLLLVLLALGTFLELFRAPDWPRTVCFAASLVAALAVRVENFAVVPALLAVVAIAWRHELRRPSAAQLLVLVLAALAAAPYLPALLLAPAHATSWWKSRLPPLRLLGSNLGFWVSGDPWTRKVPLLVGALGLATALRRDRRAAVVWLVWFALGSSIYFLYGLNLGYAVEPSSLPAWGERSAGHDMFRFDVLLLPAVVFALGTGAVRVAEAVRVGFRAAGIRGRRRAALAQAALAAAGAVGLVVWRGEWRTYRPLEFIASPYNRRFEIAEFRFLREALARVPGREVRCYVLPPAEGLALASADVRPVAALDDDSAAGGSTPYLYVKALDLRDERAVAALRDLARRYALVPVAQRGAGGEALALFALQARADARGEPPAQAPLRSLP